MITFEEKINKAIEDLRKYEPTEGYFVCFSGGKDTTVMYDLVKRSGVKYKAVHNFIAIEPPELIKHIEKNYPEVTIDRPEKNIRELIIYNGVPPFRNMRYCHRELKKGGEGMTKILGIRAEEGPKRASRPYYTENKFGGHDFNLIIDWNVQEIWRYIYQFNLPYCELYDKGRKRIGCLFCPFGTYKQTKQDLIDYPNIAKYLIDACQAAIDRRREKGLPDRFATGSDMFFNWISGGRADKEKVIEEFKNIYYSSINLIY